MKELRKKQKEEALLRMQELIDKFSLLPKLNQYLEEDRVCYSYITGNGMIGSVDTISYEPNYEEKVREFEKEYKAYVYHAIESYMSLGGKEYRFLSLLYVDSDPEEFEYGRLEGNYLTAYVINLEDNFAEFGDIFLGTFKGLANDYNTLIREG